MRAISGHDWCIDPLCTSLAKLLRTTTGNHPLAIVTMLTLFQTSIVALAGAAAVAGELKQTAADNPRTNVSS